MNAELCCLRIIVRNPLGLHARPAARFVVAVSQFDADITVRCGAASANGKSIIGLLTLCAGQGDELEIVAEGNDAPCVVAAIEDIESVLTEA